MNRTKITLLALAATLVLSCTAQQNAAAENAPQEQSTPKGQNSIDRFADIEVLRYDVPGWNDLTLKEKEYVYYLSQAGYAGRDIIWDQNYKNNLTIRRALEKVYQNYKGDKTTQDWQNFEIILNASGLRTEFTTTTPTTR